MSAGMDLLITVGLGFVVIAAVVYALAVFNGLVGLRNQIRKSWANIDVLLTQRADEIPNLVATVKGYMTHEQKTLIAVTEARVAYLKASSVAEKAGLNNELSGALKTLFAVAENYPELKASDNFLALQKRISGLENEIADRRELYNDSVTLYNTRIHSIPDLLVANLLKYKDEEWFKAEAGKRNVLEVKLN
jgi:LemA protein